MQIYTRTRKLANPAMTMPAKPLEILPAAPVKGVMGLDTAVGTALTEAKVDAPVGP